MINSFIEVEAVNCEHLVLENIKSSNFPFTKHNIVSYQEKDCDVLLPTSFTSRLTHFCSVQRKSREDYNEILFLDECVYINIESIGGVKKVYCPKALEFYSSHLIIKFEQVYAPNVKLLSIGGLLGVTKIKESSFSECYFPNLQVIERRDSGFSSLRELIRREDNQTFFDKLGGNYSGFLSVCVCKQVLPFPIWEELALSIKT